MILKTVEYTETKKMWIIEHGKHQIPVSDTLRLIFTIVCIAMTFQIGKLGSALIIQMAEQAPTICHAPDCSYNISQGAFGEVVIAYNITHQQNKSNSSLLNFTQN